MHSLRCQRPCMQSAYFVSAHSCMLTQTHLHACLMLLHEYAQMAERREHFLVPRGKTALETAGAAARFGPALAAAVRPEQDSLRERERGPILSAGSMGCRLLQYALGLGLCLRLRLTFSLGLGFPLRLGNFLELLSRSLALASILAVVQCIGHFGSFL